MAKSLDQTAEQLGNILLSSGLHLATAESCTAGLISMTLAAVENSGDFYTSGFVTYSENAKIRLLGVRPDTLKQHTAVSETDGAGDGAGRLRPLWRASGIIHYRLCRTGWRRRWYTGGHHLVWLGIA